MKTADLTDAQLDYWVAKGLATIDDVFAAKYSRPLVMNHHCHVGHGHATVSEFVRHMANAPEYELSRMWFMPSIRWEEGGPIILRERIVIQPCYDDEWQAGVMSHYGHEGPESDWWQEGPTPLIAAMRAFVASKFGADLPDS